MGLDEFSGFETFVGSRFDDFMRTSNGGFGGYREFIYGGDGDDIVYASRGADIYHGDAGFDTVDFSGMYNSVLIDFGNAGPYNHDARIGDDIYKLVDFESYIGSRTDDTFIGDARDSWFEGGFGDDTATGAGGEDVFVFRDRGDSFGFDRVTDFTHGEDAVMLDGLHAWDGSAIGHWSDLDTNGNGQLDHGDASIWFTHDSALLLFGEGTVELENVSTLHASDFLFA
ncbi:calcium-binding protein [Mangrovicoccus ximenensis]|uniref:hypothetical protein n=1 Tax=Mangrovicoccus ximenensis TaxID=1911570 RepID=UPI000D3675E6|nr:hypothetical protein [Mangrovicoccus ximenensis]